MAEGWQRGGRGVAEGWQRGQRSRCGVELFVSDVAGPIRLAQVTREAKRLRQEKSKMESDASTRAFERESLMQAAHASRVPTMGRLERTVLRAMHWQHTPCCVPPPIARPARFATLTPRRNRGAPSHRASRSSSSTRFAPTARRGARGARCQPSSRGAAQATSTRSSATRWNRRVRICRRRPRQQCKARSKARRRGRGRCCCRRASSTRRPPISRSPSRPTRTRSWCWRSLATTSRQRDVVVARWLGVVVGDSS